MRALNHITMRALNQITMRALNQITMRAPIGASHNQYDKSNTTKMAN